MKFIHIADVHLGVSPEAGRAYSNRRPGEIWKSLESIVRICNREEIQLLLIAGDLFHRQPLLRELKEVNAIFRDLVQTRVVLIAGNHDHLTDRSYYKSISWAEHIYFLGREPGLDLVEFPDLRTAVYGKSYHSREIRAAVDQSYERNYLQPYEILLLHGGDENHTPFQKETLSDLDYDYVALGHIHKPGIVLEGRAAYAGAPEPTDRNDLGPHGYIQGELGRSGCRLQFVAHAKREYIPLSVSLRPESTAHDVQRRIEEEIQTRGCEHLYKIRLSGRRSPDLLIDREEMDRFGNIVEWIDDTKPAYDLERLKQNNRDNLLGQLIREMEETPEESREYRALARGIQALLETTR